MVSEENLCGMLTYSFQSAGSKPLYQHLYQCIKHDIVQGTLAADEKLPSKRSFAKNLGISTITVENAYAQLCVFSAEKGFFCDGYQKKSVGKGK